LFRFLWCCLQCESLVNPIETSELHPLLLFIAANIAYSCPMRTNDENQQFVAEFKRKLASFYGYDQEFRFVRNTKSEPRATGIKESLEPRDFLNFAVADSGALGDERNRVNCLGNSKRAIDCQVDRLIQRLGYLPLARKERWDIPRKLKFIERVGVVAPRILRRLNTLRNRLEHQFSPPAKDQVEDALDIATLFISYAEIVQIPSLNWSLTDKLAVRYDYERMSFRFFDHRLSVVEDDADPIFSLGYGEASFQDFYDFLVRVVPEMQRKTDLGEDVQTKKG
jgi:hypothetical protein